MKYKNIITVLLGIIGTTLIAGTETVPVGTETTFASLTDTDLELAEPAWNRHCAKCHGKDGNGPASRMGQRLGLKINYAEPGALDGFSDEQMDSITADGIEDTKMNGFSSKLSPEEISALTRYMRSFSKT